MAGQKTMGREKKKMSFKTRQKIAGYAFALPLIFGIICLFVPNIIKTFVFSTNEIVIGNYTYSLEGRGLEYYYNALFVNADFIQHLIRSFGSMAVQVPTIIIFSLFMASVLNQKFKGRVFARAIFFLPVVLATGLIARADSYYDLVGALTGRVSFDEDSVQFVSVASLLYQLNFNEKLIEIIVNAARGIETIVTSSGMQIFVLLTAFQEIPPALYEAAAIDGASKWEVFWKITIPSVRRQIIICAVYTVIDSFTKADNPVFYYVRQIAFQGNQYGLAMAMYVIYLTVLGLMLALIMGAFVRRARKKGYE